MSRMETDRTDQDERADETISSAEIIERVRAVVEERRRRGSWSTGPQGLDPQPDRVEGSDAFPWRRPEGTGWPVGFAFVNDFVELPGDERFLTFCYHALLRRHPRDPELQRWLRRMSGGWPRLAVLLAIRESGEGRARGIRLRGFWRRFFRDLAHRARRALRRRESRP